MKLFISLDLEGCTGVVDVSQTRPAGARFEAARALARADLEAVLAGCRMAGAGTIVVCDAHGHGATLEAGELGDDVELVCRPAGPLGMMSGIDETCDGALLVGYHAMAGTRAAVLDHTFTQHVFRVRVDDSVEAGELGLNAAVAGAHGVPVVFVSGDDKLVTEARELLPGVGGAIVKEGIARGGARLAPPRATGDLLRAAAAEALDRALGGDERPRPLVWDERPLRIVFTRSDHADAAALCPGVERVDARSVRIDASRYLDAYRTLLACLGLASTVKP